MPPKSTRFKKGKSGNPKGRPPRSQNVETILQNTLFRLVSVKEGGKLRKVALLEAFLMLISKTALGGSSTAANQMIRLLPLMIQAQQTLQAGELTESEEATSGQVEQVNQDVLQHFADMVRGSGLVFGEEGDA